MQDKTPSVIYDDNEIVNHSSKPIFPTCWLPT